MKQISLDQAEHQNKKKVTRRSRFLAQMVLLGFVRKVILANVTYA